MDKSVIIVAGGKGLRMNTEIPKQFLLLRDLPVLMHSVKKFYDFDNTINIIIVLPENQIQYWQQLCKKHNFSIKHTIAKGGQERFHSVKNGLKFISTKGYTAIHDGVRPLVSLSTIAQGFELAKKHKAVVPATTPTSSIRIIENNSNKHIDRNKIKLVQTPQIFENQLLTQAYSTEYKNIFTDDASVVEHYGQKIFIYEGNIENIKITTKFDLKLANFWLNNNEQFQQKT